MPGPDPHDQGTTRSPTPPSPPTGFHQPPGPHRDQDTDAGEDRYIRIAEKFLGSVLMFVGFLNVLLSLSGGFEIDTVPIILYCAGLALWAHSTLTHPTIQYSVIAGAVIVALAFFHYGEVHFWHKQLIFWGTVALVVVFMFLPSPKAPPLDDDDRNRHSNPE